MMKNLKSYLSILIIAYLLIIAASCNDDEKMSTPFSTDFNRSTIESQTYSVGDSVKADINIIPTKPLKNLRCYYLAGLSGTGFSTAHEEIALNDSAEPFTYKFRFKIGEQFRDQEKIRVSVDVFVTEREPNGWAGDTIAEFIINFK